MLNISTPHQYQCRYFLFVGLIFVSSLLLLICCCQIGSRSASIRQFLLFILLSPLLFSFFSLRNISLLAFALPLPFYCISVFLFSSVRIFALFSSVFFFSELPLAIQLLAGSALVLLHLLHYPESCTCNYIILYTVRRHFTHTQIWCSLHFL